jgi:hypothetical protein
MSWRRLALWTAVTIALLSVFAAYLRPDLAFSLATQLWNCF